MIQGTLHSRFTAPPGSSRQARRVLSGYTVLDGDALLIAFGDLDAQLHPRHRAVSFTARLRHPGVELDFRQAAQALRACGLLTALLHELERVTPTGRVLTSLSAPDLHEVYHDSLLDDAAEHHGLDRDLMDDEAYEQALFDLGLPVLRGDTYDPTLHGFDQSRTWPARRPPQCPAWLWAGADVAVQYARAASPREVGHDCPLLFPRLLLTCDDRLPHLFDELRHCGADHVPTRTVRRLMHLQRAADDAWSALHDLEHRARHRGGTP